MFSISLTYLMYLDMRRDHLHIHKLCFVFISTDEYYKMTMNTVNDLRCILIEIQKKKKGNKCYAYFLYLILQVFPIFTGCQNNW